MVQIYFCDVIHIILRPVLIFAVAKKKKEKVGTNSVHSVAVAVEAKMSGSYKSSFRSLPSSEPSPLTTSASKHFFSNLLHHFLNQTYRANYSNIGEYIFNWNYFIVTRFHHEDP